MENILMAVSDLDYTLLRNDKSISRYTVEVYARCRQRGILTGFATARSEKSASRFIDALQPDLVISNGGALARFRGEILYRHMLSADTADSIVHDLRTFDDVGIITEECDSAYYVSYKEPSYEIDYLHGKYHDFSVPVGEDSYKISTEIFSRVTEEAMKAKYSMCRVYRFTGEAWCRFSHMDADKAEALRASATMLGIPTENIAAFGDDQNDIDMLTSCGAGVAVLNAHDIVKSRVKYITDSNEYDGVAKWIDKYVLRQEL